MATPITRATLAAALAGFSGLDYHVALNWLNAENSVAGNGTNPLGILAGNSAGSGLEVGSSGRFAVYRSALDGVKAAAWLLAHGSHYPAVRTAIATGTPAQQRAAIVGSGWAAGNYHGGTSFSSAGISGTASSLAGSDMSAASITPTAAIAASAGIDAGASGTGVTASAPFIDIPDGKVLTYQDMLHIVFLYGAHPPSRQAVQRMAQADDLIGEALGAGAGAPPTHPTPPAQQGRRAAQGGAAPRPSAAAAGSERVVPQGGAGHGGEEEEEEDLMLSRPVKRRQLQLEGLQQRQQQRQQLVWQERRSAWPRRADDDNANGDAGQVGHSKAVVWCRPGGAQHGCRALG